MITSENLQQRDVTFKPGDTVRVHYRVIEGNRERIQVFEGLVIARKGRGVSETFTVRLSGPNVASNLQTPPTAKVQIVDDEATPGPLTPLVNVPQQSLKDVLERKEVRYRYSCNRACDEATVLRLKKAELGRSASSLLAQGAANEDVRLGKDAGKALRTASG